MAITDMHNSVRYRHLQPALGEVEGCRARICRRYATRPHIAPKGSDTLESDQRDVWGTQLTTDN
jgi:hypothetical protein